MGPRRRLRRGLVQRSRGKPRNISLHRKPQQLALERSASAIDVAAVAATGT